MANVRLNSLDLEQALKSFSLAVEKKDIVNAKIAVDIMAGLSLTFQLLGQTDQAMKIMERLVDFTENIGESAHIAVAESCKYRLLLLQGELKKTIEWARSFDVEVHVPSMNFWVENPAITQARIFIVAGTKDDGARALDLLDSLGKQVNDLHNTYQTIEILVLKSAALEKLERGDEALKVLGEVVDLARPGGWIRPFVELGSIMADMLKRLEAKDITRDYIEILINAIEKQKTVSVNEIQVSADAEPLLRSAVAPTGENDRLTTREMEVLTLLAKGFRNKEIAAELFLSSETIKRHLYNVFQKFNVSSRMQAISVAREMGLIE